jgi:hypothetical protein
MILFRLPQGDPMRSNCAAPRLLPRRSYAKQLCSSKAARSRGALHQKSPHSNSAGMWGVSLRGRETQGVWLGGDAHHPHSEPHPSTAPHRDRRHWLSRAPREAKAAACGCMRRMRRQSVQHLQYLTASLGRHCGSTPTLAAPHLHRPLLRLACKCHPP